MSDELSDVIAQIKREQAEYAVAMLKRARHRAISRQTAVATQAARSPAERAVFARIGGLKGGVVTNAKTTPEQRRAWGLKGAVGRVAKTTLEQRSEWGRKSAAKRLRRQTFEQRSEAARRGVTTRRKRYTPEQRSETARKASAVYLAMTPEQRSEIACRSVATRKARPNVRLEERKRGRKANCIRNHGRECGCWRRGDNLEYEI